MDYYKICVKFDSSIKAQLKEIHGMIKFLNKTYNLGITWVEDLNFGNLSQALHVLSVLQEKYIHCPMYVFTIHHCVTVRII